MATMNKTKYAILGVLCIKPGSGYDIKKFCDNSISYFWNENFGHIYPVLKDLEKHQLIHQVNIGENERRKIYNITEAGRKELISWMMQPIELQPPRVELLLRLSFGNFVEKEHMIHMIEGVKQGYIKQLELFRKIEEAYYTDPNAKNDPSYPYWLSSLRFGILSRDITVKWCDETVQTIQQFTTD